MFLINRAATYVTIESSLLDWCLLVRAINHHLS